VIRLAVGLAVVLIVYSLTAYFSAARVRPAEHVAAEFAGERAELERDYAELLEHRKRPEIRVSSRTPDYNACEAYRRIVARGAAALPFVIEKIGAGDFFLNQAMREITGLDIRSHYRDVPLLGEQDESALWLRWWAEHGHP
jgi:hypothetical protein